MKTTAGKSLVKTLFAIADNGGGWFAIYWQNPVNKTRQLKILYVKKLDANYVIGSGYYSLKWFIIWQFNKGKFLLILMN